jgi:transcriptional regulator with XRE-family HTH domain
MDAAGFAQRLRELREERGIGSRELSERIDRSPSFISLIESRQRYKTKLPPTEALMKIARELGLTLEEMIGPLPAPTHREERTPARPRLLTEHDLFARFGIRRYEEPQSGEGLRYSAGPSGGVVQGIDDTLPRRVKGSKYLWAAPVVGDCMEQEIHAGEVVIYSTRAPIEIGRIVVALRDEDELLIKRLRLAGDRQVLRPNRGEDVPVDERIRFLGRGMAVQRPL